MKSTRIIPYLLVAATIGVVVLYMQNRAVDAVSHAHRMELLLRLRQLDTQLDRDMLRVSSLELRQYDSLVHLANEIRTTGRRLAGAEGGFVGETNGQVEAALARSLEIMTRKLDGLERIKSEASVVRNGLQYLPIALDQYSMRDPVQGAHLSRLLNRLYATHFFFAKSDIGWLRHHLLQARTKGPADDELFNSIMFHMRTYLAATETLGQLRASVAAEPSAAEIAKLHSTYENFYNERSARSDQVSRALLVATMLLFAALAFAVRRLNEARLEAEQARLKLHDAVASLSEAFSLFDANGRLLLFNDRFLAFYPWLRGRIAPGEHLDQIRAITRSGDHLPIPGKDPDGPCTAPCNYIQQTDDGRWYLASDNRTSEGGLVCVRMDITESKRHELELRKLTRALNQSPVSVVITDTNGTIEYVNPKFEEVTGYSAAESIGNNPRMLKSGEKRQRDYQKLWETITAGREWRGVFLNRRKNGDVFWESASISPLRDEQGRITHFIGVKEDITERKRDEDTLRLHATVFDTTTEGIIVTDASNQIRTVNPAFTRITGYTAEEVIGRDPRLLSSGRHGPEFYVQMWRALVNTGQWSGEIWNRHKDGSIYPEWLSIVAIRDEDGRTQEFIAVFSDITQRKRDEEQILRQANYDALTGLPNRTLLFDRLSQAMHVAAREGTQVALLFIDLDRFKSINDALGHVTGDEMLRQVADRLRGCVRQSDTVARFGGDEFVIVLEGVPSVAAVAALAEKVIGAISEPYYLAERELFIGASIGVSLFPDDSRDADVLMRSADVAMYQAKEAGRNRLKFFTQEMNRRTEVRLELERGLRRAIERDQLRLEYQPIYHLATGKLVQVEALLRWHHPELGRIPPERFIPLAEESGLIGPIELWVLRSACAQVKAWQQLPGMEHLRLATNFSSRQWKLGLTVETIAKVLEQTGLRPQALTIEITEGLVLDGTEQVISWLHQIRALGVELAVDDFGTGYSSLSYLKRFPVSELKIDYSFVRDLPGDEGSVSLVRAILSLAHSLGLSVVAEGVEKEEQLVFLEQARCDLVQGFLLSTPQPPERIPALVYGAAGNGYLHQTAADLFS